LLLILAGGLAWLTFADRMSPLALTVVEWESMIGVPISAIAGLAGVLFLVLGARKRTVPTPPASVEQRRPSRRAGIEPSISPDVNSDWVGDVIQRARALPLDDGVQIKLDEGSGIPFTLFLERVTPEVERRSLDAFSSFLSSIPTPQRAKVVFVGKNTTGVPRQHSVKGSLRRVFHATAYQVIPQQNWVDVLFFAPDPSWADRPFLFLDQ
jgi:hypothetical protein